MFRNLYTRLIIIFVVAALAIWIDVTDTIRIPNLFNQSASTPWFQRNVSPRLGLDLRGGVQVLLEADVAADYKVNAEDMQVARTIIENRTNALGVSENVIQVAGERRIVGEFPGVEDSESIIAILRKTGLLEFIDTGDVALDPGTVVQTDYIETGATDTTQPQDPNAPAPVNYHTVMTRKDLTSVAVETDQFGIPQIAFALSSAGSKIFSDFTTANVGKHLTIVLDKQVISSPTIDSAITSGSGVINGSFTSEEANTLAVQLRYGSLPIPLKIVETRIIGPTLGEDSLRKSLIAGLVGTLIVILFMGVYYRLPGIAADLSILFYAAIAFALFKYIPVTLTLPGIAGFLLSTGSALDANILVFERLKEELRGGRTLWQAFDQAWIRAWPSIRDSNIAALITSGILFWFGSTFGATIVKGFALTLALGVIISVFSALFITRALLEIALRIFKPTNLSRWIGI